MMWVHVVSMWCITLYATWLLRRHTRTFALLRQLYLTTAGDTNLWRAVHMPTRQGQPDNALSALEDAHTHTPIVDHLNELNQSLKRCL